MLSTLGKRIILCFFLILALFWLVFFFWLSREQKQFFIEQLRHQAEGIYHYIILTRQWISLHGGIYLKNNNKYLFLTPSHFTKEIADFAQKKLPYQIKIAVINAHNPIHQPDNFEKEAILNFQKGKAKEVWKVVHTSAGPLFRYAAPLVVQRECAKCHWQMKRQKIPGCISISFSAASVFEEFKKNQMFLIIGLMATLLLIFFLLCYLLRVFVLNPLNIFVQALQEIEKGNLNVRVNVKTGDEWERLAQSFNQMVEGLASYQRELEKKVKEATAELAKAYEELKKTEQFKSEFFSSITHDLKTPITAIKGAVELLLRKEKSEKDKSYLVIIQKNVNKLSKMIKDLLDCAKIESGQLELKKEKNDLIQTIQETVFMANPLAWEKKIKILCEIPKKPIMFSFDKERIQQVILNLLSNAIKFSPFGKEIKVIVKSQDDQIIISIEDFGPGIPKEEWPLVFQKFYRYKKKFYRYKNMKGEGLGLGLAICKGIVEAHGGRIWITQPEHAGIVFNVSLPLGGKGNE
jgi:signal transduction histidine kinase